MIKGASSRRSVISSHSSRPPLAPTLPRVKSVDQMSAYKDYLQKAVAATEELSKNTRLGERERMYGQPEASKL